MKLSDNQKYNRLAKEKYFDFLPPQKGKKILDVGCGGGSYLNFFQKRGILCYGLNISPQQIKQCQKAGLKNVDAKKAGHLRIFSEKKLVNLLQPHFVVEQINYKNCLGEIIKVRFNQDFKIFTRPFDLSSTHLFRPMLKYMGTAIFVKVRKND